MRWKKLNARTVLRLVLVAFLGATALYGLFSLHAQYQEAIRDTSVRAETVALLLEQHAVRTIDAADQLVQRAGERLAPNGVRPYGEADWRVLRDLAATMAPIEALAVFDRDGHIRLTSRIFPAPDYSAADRDYFRDHRDKGVAFVLGQAVRSRTSLGSQSFFTISRSIVGDDGSFQGAVVAVIDTDYFSGLYQQLKLGEHAALALLRTDGALLLREPFSPRLLDPGMAEKIRTWKLFTDYIDHGIAAGTYEGPTTADGLTRTFAFRKMDHLPLLVLVMLAHDDAVLEMLPGILRSAGLGFTLLCFLAVLTWLSFRVLDREDHARRDLADANRSLATALDAAEAASRAKSTFLSNMSHELRTPLNAIIGFSEALRDGYAGPISDKQREYLGHIRDGGRHLLEIISDVLDLSKVASGTLSLNEEIVDLGAVTRSCVQLMSDKARAKGIALDVEVAPNLPELSADTLRCRQILLNLLSNALKFTPSGGTVVVSLRRDKTGGVMLEVQDSGLGMDPADLASALDAFGLLASSPTKAQGGAGIGLPLAKKLAELHGADLTIDTGLGRGTLVMVRFPPDRVLSGASATY